MVHWLCEMDRDAGILSRYWVTYYLVYFGVAIGLALSHSDDLSSADGLYVGAAIVAVSAGIAVAAAVSVEIGGSLLMLLIPATFRYLQRKERERAQQERDDAVKARDDAVREWVEANPAIKEMIESGTVPPPPNGTAEDK